MRKEVIAPILVLLMLVGMGSYAMMNNDSTGDESPDEGIDDNQFSDEWDVYYVDSGSDLPACGSATLGRLYYVASTAGFETCTSAGWAFVNLTGPSGPAGPPGVDGVNGTDGADGVDGVNGTDGADGEKGEVGEDGDDGMDGMSALAVTTPETAGSNCADGGLKIEVGVDGNGNGALDSNEVSYTEYVCNGADGANGSASPNTMLTSVSTPSRQVCSAGGRIIEQGHDNGDGGGTSQNGVLESGEVDYTTTYCSNFVVKQIADIRSGINSGYANHIVAMGTRLYFEATDGISGAELWVHETTNGSTWQVADINSGSTGSYLGHFTVMGSRLYFQADDGSSGYELWAHETNNESTWQVADIYSGGTSGYAVS